jgi:hypothetical protein
VDPQMMISLMRRDFQSRRWLTVALLAVLILAALSWFPALAARRAARGAPHQRFGRSVLSDPFATPVSARSSAS